MGELLTVKPAILFIDNIAVESAKRSFYRAVAALGTYEVHLLVPATWKEQGGVVAAEPEPDPAVHVHVSPILFGHRQHRVLHLGLPRLLRTLRPSLLYVDSEPENYTAVYARRAIRRASPETRLALVSCRNMDYRAQGFPYKAAFTHRWCDTAFLKHPADILYARPASGVSLLQGYARNVVHLPYVIDAGVFTPAGGRRGGREDVTIGYLGRLVPEKGVDLLVRACATLPASVHLVIAGRGPMRDTLGAIAVQAGIGDRVRIVDAVPYAGVPAFLRSLDILALPSRPSTIWMEQFGRVLIEAMACGVPVVASNSGEIPSVLADGGVLVPPGDTEALGNALRMLAASADRRTQIGNAGRARALATFDATAVASWFLETLRPLGPPFIPAAM